MAASDKKDLNQYIKRSNFIDQFLIDMIDNKSAKLTKNILAIIAVGGYGRKELAPFSDIDVIFLVKDQADKKTRGDIEAIAAAFWNQKTKLSYSVRTIDECREDMGRDIHFLTSLLEKRLVWGDKKTFKALDTAVGEHLAASPPRVFIAAKLDERDARHIKMGDSRYQLQPNVKESKGALRDIQTLLWLSNFLFGVTTPEGLAKKKILTSAEAKTLQKAYDFFQEIRFHLHTLSGRADDRLSFEIQPDVATHMGYKDKDPQKRAETFMKDYFEMANEVGHLTRVICTDLDARSLSGGATAGTRNIERENDVDGFELVHNRLVADPKKLKKEPGEIIRLFRTHQISHYDLHPDTYRHIREHKGHPDDLRGFFEILTDEDAEKTLRHMNECGVLTALIPDFANIYCHMQYDMYHVYTADEHTLRAIGTLHKLEGGKLAEAAPFATDLFNTIHSRNTLFAAMFLHDIGKGTGEDHSSEGAAIAKKYCPLFGLKPEETDTVIWLVENHLLMTSTAFKRNLSDEKTIADFVAIVQSPERLKLLTLLTVADIMAVGPEQWNNWKSGLLTELYTRALALMSGTDQEQDMLKPYRDMLKKDGTDIRITQHTAQDFTEVAISTEDRKGLFAILSGAIAASGASIVAARIFTLPNSRILDVFEIQTLNGKTYENGKFLKEKILGALEDKIDIAAEIETRQKNLPQRARTFAVPPRVIIDNDASNLNTVIEVNGKDRPGLLYDLTSALTQEGLQISAAKVATFGSRAIDVFYVRDSFGLKISHPGKLAEIEKILDNTLRRA
jgi:[protein-PII] uridylyltransferase